jgi:hypothetical protein
MVQFLSRVFPQHLPRSNLHSKKATVHAPGQMEEIFINEIAAHTLEHSMLGGGQLAVLPC